MFFEASHNEKTSAASSLTSGSTETAQHSCGRRVRPMRQLVLEEFRRFPETVRQFHDHDALKTAFSKSGLTFIEAKQDDPRTPMVAHR